MAKRSSIGHFGLKSIITWLIWKIFTLGVGLGDNNMQTGTEHQKVHLLQAFMEAVYCSGFAKGHKKGFKGSNTQEAMDHVCSTHPRTLLASLCSYWGTKCRAT
eukprot:2819091-Ditylum_brightwellii.AAC.1